MIYIILNAGPILAATVVGLAIGFLWMRSGSVDSGTAQAKPGLGFAVIAFVAEFWLASILAGALILAPPEAGEWTMAIGSAVVIWVGFVMPALLVSERFRGTPWRVVASDCGHWLVVMVAQAVVLKAIGLVPPPGAV